MQLPVTDHLTHWKIRFFITFNRYHYIDLDNNFMAIVLDVYALKAIVQWHFVQFFVVLVFYQEMLVFQSQHPSSYVCFVLSILFLGVEH